MAHRFLLVHEMDKAKVAAAISKGVARTMIFSRTKRGADRLASSLKQEGVRAAAIHGDLPQRIRERALDDFQNGKLPVLVATDVAARGLAHRRRRRSSCTTTRPRITRRTSTVRAARPGPASAGLVVTLVLWNEELEVKRLLPAHRRASSRSSRSSRTIRVSPIWWRGIRRSPKPTAGVDPVQPIAAKASA